MSTAFLERGRGRTRTCRIVYLLTAMLLLAWNATSAKAWTYYVSPTGNDGASGLSGAPWLSLQHAADLAAAGDEVIVQPGTYQGFNVLHSGTDEAHPITFSAQPGVLINTAAPVLPAYGYRGLGQHTRIYMYDVSYVTVQGFEITGTNNQLNSKEGIFIGADPATNYGHIKIFNNNIHHNGDRNVLTSHVNYLDFENNIFHEAYEEHGLYISNSGDHHIVKNNISYGNSGAGIQFNADLSFGGELGADGIITDALVENNIIFDNGHAGVPFTSSTDGLPHTTPGGGSAFNMDGLQNSIIQNNLLFNNHYFGISLFQGDGAQPSKNDALINNTIINASGSRSAINITDASTGTTIFNNIFFNLGTNAAVSLSTNCLSGTVSDDNFFEQSLSFGSSSLTLAQWIAQTGQDAHSHTLTLAQLQALFTNYSLDPQLANFSLAAGSTAIDAGIAGLFNGATYFAAPGDDLLGLPRPLGAGYDVGAYERVPEPATLAILAIGGLVLLRRRKATMPARA